MIWKRKMKTFTDDELDYIFLINSRNSEVRKFKDKYRVEVCGFFVCLAIGDHLVKKHLKY